MGMRPGEVCMGMGPGEACMGMGPGEAWNEAEKEHTIASCLRYSISGPSGELKESRTIDKSWIHSESHHTRNWLMVS